MPSGSNILWSVNGGYSIIGSSTGSTVQIQSPTFTAQFAQLVAKLENNCGELNIIKNLVPATITIESSVNGICGEASATINMPSGANFHWTADGDVTINGQGQSVYTTNNNVGIVGVYGTVTCTFLSYNNTVTTYVVHAPYQRTINVAANPMVNSDPLSASILNIDYGYNAIKWYIDGILINTGNSQLFETNQPSCGIHILSAKADLSCGATVLVGSIEIERYCSGWWRSVGPYPNPASSILNVGPNENETKKMSVAEKGKMSEYEVWLYDIKGKIRAQSKSKNYLVELDVRNLENDTYFLHIRSDSEKEIIKKQVIIQH